MGEKTKTSKEPKIKWVKSWRDIPSSHPDIDPVSAGEIARYNPNKNVIYAIKDKTSASDLEHEKYHVMKSQSHGYGYRESASDYVAEELEASKYAYDKTGHPKHILMILQAIGWDLLESKTFKKNVKPSKTLEIIEKQLLKVDPPQGWLSDYEKLVADAHKGWQRRKDNPKSFFYLDAEPKVSSRFRLRVHPVKDKMLLRSKKPWWDDEFYRNQPIEAKHTNRGVSHKNSLLPPQFGEKL